MPAAMLTMFASATPTLVKRDGCASRKGSSTLKPRSAVKRWMSAPAEAASARVLMAVLRTVELRERRLVFRRVRAAVVPEQRIFHEGDPLAFDGVGNDCAGLAGLERHGPERVQD